LRAIIGQNALSHVDARLSQLRNTIAGMPRIYINRSDNHVPDARLKYRFRAGSSVSSCGARLESNVKRSPRGHRCGEIAKAFDLSVIAARSSMVSFCHNSVANDEDRSHRGIRAGLTKRFHCLVQRGAHEPFVSFSIHIFETSIIVFALRGNACCPM
jgi:hypothetical protein